MLFRDYLTVVRGGGDLATGVVYRLHKAGFPLIVLELPDPLVVRRMVAVATAIKAGHARVEELDAVRTTSAAEALAHARNGRIPVMPSPSLPHFDPAPTIVVDARMAKRNIDTSRDDAPLVVALGPGFTAGVSCDAVIETMRGHTLGRVIWQGAALPNTGTPGIVAGKGAERVLRAPADGVVQWRFEIGDRVRADAIVGMVANRPIRAPFDGVVRGLIAPGSGVRAGLKIGDIDARGDVAACTTISDKALAVGGGVVQAVLEWLNR